MNAVIVHAISTSFPFVTLFLLLLLEFTVHSEQAQKRIRFIMCTVIVLSIIAAYASGLLLQSDAVEIYQVPSTSVDFHFQLARVTLILSLLASAFGIVSLFMDVAPRIYIERIYKFLLLTSLVTAAFTSHYGSSLVYRHGAGVGESLSFRE